MVETLTESFCERCGTRYEFRAPTRLNPLRKTRGFIGGLKNYLTSQDALSDAMGDAMRTEEDQLASAQLEAFHESFNFCIGCRQYTCLNCWNDGDGRCRTCAPVPGTDDLAERLAASFTQGSAPMPTTAVEDEPIMAQDAIQRRLGLDGWPSADTSGAPATNGHAAIEWPAADDIVAQPAYEPEPEPVVAHDTEPEPMVAETEPEPEPMIAETVPERGPMVAETVPERGPMVAETEPEPEPMIAETVPERGPMVAETEPEPEPMIAETVPERGPMVAETEPEPVVAHEAEPEAMVSDTEPEPEPMVAETEPEPEPIVAENEPEPVVGLEPEPAAAERRPLRVVAWDDDAAYEVEPEPLPLIAEVEPEPVVAEVEPEPEPVAAEDPEAMAEVELEVEPVADEAGATAEPVAKPTAPAIEEPPAPSGARPARRIAPIRETILPFPPPAAPSTPDGNEQPVAAEVASPEVAARRAQLDVLGLGDPGEGPVRPERPGVIPYRSRGAAPTPIELAARGAFWDASAREVAAAAANIGVQSCGQCGLSLSANARFCRRCGTRQAQSA